MVTERFFNENFILFELHFSGDDRKRGNIAFCLSKLNIKTLASYRILKENFPTITETEGENEADYDTEEHLAWKKYLLVNIQIEVFSKKISFILAGSERY